MVKKRKAINNLITLVLVTHIFSWILFMPIFQFQMILFKKRVLTFVHFGLFEIFLITILFIMLKGIIRVDKVTKLSLTLSGLFFLSGIINIFKQGTNDPSVVMFYMMCWVFPFLLVCIVHQYDYSIDKVFNFLLIIVIIHALIIFYQSLSNSFFWPFISDESGNKIFEMNQYYNTGKFSMRCTGITTTGLDAGILLLFGIVLTLIKGNIKFINRMVLILLFTVSIIFTGTRNIYVMFLYMLLAVCFLRVDIEKEKKKWLLLLFTCVFGIAYFYIISGIDHYTTTGNLMSDTTSIGIRLSKWEHTVNIFRESSIMDLLFGFMKWQNAGNCEVIDNMYLEITYCSGLLCMIYYIRYIINIAEYIVSNGSYFSFIVSSFSLCYLIYGVLNGSSNFYFTLIILLLLKNNNHKSQCG